MQQKKRFTSYLLLFIFGFLFLKNLLPNIADLNHHNHDEVGHIHFFQVHKAKPTDSFETTESRQSDNDDENCSSGKSIFAFSPVPDETYKIIIPSLTMAFNLIFKLDNNFKTPYLEPRKKPPRLA